MRSVAYPAECFRTVNFQRHFALVNSDLPESSLLFKVLLVSLVLAG